MLFQLIILFLFQPWERCHTSETSYTLEAFCSEFSLHWRCFRARSIAAGTWQLIPVVEGLLAWYFSSWRLVCLLRSSWWRMFVNSVRGAIISIVCPTQTTSARIWTRMDFQTMRTYLKNVSRPLLGTPESQSGESGLWKRGGVSCKNNKIQRAENCFYSLTFSFPHRLFTRAIWSCSASATKKSQWKSQLNRNNNRPCELGLNGAYATLRARVQQKRLFLKLKKVPKACFKL